MQFSREQVLMPYKETERTRIDASTRHLPERQGACHVHDILLRTTSGLLTQTYILTGRQGGSAPVAHAGMQPAARAEQLAERAASNSASRRAGGAV